MRKYWFLIIPFILFFLIVGVQVVMAASASDKWATTSIPEVGDSGTAWGTNLRGYLLSVDAWANTDIPVADGGTGAGTFTDGGILLGSGTSAITALGAATNGQIPIGDGTTDPQLATITATANETDVTNGAGSITIGIVASPTLDGTNFTGIPDAALPSTITANAFTGTTVTIGTSLIISDDTINDFAGTGLSVSANVLTAATADSTTLGLVEVATIAETNTGTSLILAVSPDSLDGWTGSAQINTLGTIGAGTWNATALTDLYIDESTLEAADLQGAHSDESNADSVTQGIVEVATIAETNTGTSLTLAVSPDALEGWTGSGQIDSLGTVTSGTISTGASVVDAALPATATFNAVTGTTGTFDALNLTSVCATDANYLVWNTGNAVSCVTLAGGGDFLADGTVPMTDDIQMDGNNVAEATTRAGFAYIGTTDTTSIVISGDTITDFAGTGLSVSSNKLTAATATLTVLGMTEYATTTETIAGTDATRSVTPDGLTDALADAGVVDWTSDQGATNIDSGNVPLAATATALAADPANCAAGSAALGITAAGVAEGCFDVVVPTEIDAWDEHPAVTATYILVGNGSNAAVAVDMTGDVSIDNAGVTAVANDSHTHTAANISDTVSSTTASVIETATVAETNTGTSLILAVTPDAIDSWTGNTAITSVGAIATGTWASTDIPLANGGTGSSTAVAARAVLEAPPPMESRTIGGSALTVATYGLLKAPVAITITDIHCITDTGTVEFELEEGTATAYDGGTVVDAVITCDSNQAEDDGSLTNGTIAANAWIAARIGTEASSPTQLIFTFFYTVD